MAENRKLETGATPVLRHGSGAGGQDGALHRNRVNAALQTGLLKFPNSAIEFFTQLEILT
jgi:hypothetical protein